jgi:hypothetical protein
MIYRNGGKIRVKNNMMGKAARETSLEILGLKGHYYKMMFDPNDLIMIMLCAVFKVVRTTLFQKNLESDRIYQGHSNY